MGFVVEMDILQTKEIGRFFAKPERDVVSVAGVKTSGEDILTALQAAHDQLQVMIDDYTDRAERAAHDEKTAELAKALAESAPQAAVGEGFQKRSEPVHGGFTVIEEEINKEGK